MSTISYATLPVLEGYHRPRTLGAALRLLERLGPEAAVLAGGTDLIVDMRARVSRPRHLVDITGIPSLTGVRPRADGGLGLGATTTIGEVARSAVILARFPMLTEAARTMGTVQVNNLATVAGNVCRASPSADMACPLLALDAAVEIAGAGDTRTVPLAGFSMGSRRTVLRPGELVTALVVPPPAPGSGGAFLRSTRTASDLARFNVAAVVTLEGDVCGRARIVMGSVAARLLRAAAAEDVLRGARVDDALVARAAQAAAAACDPRAGDLQATPAGKKVLAEVFTGRVLRLALARAGRAAAAAKTAGHGRPDADA